MKLKKDARICELLRNLELESRGWVVVDHWNADRCAVGVALSSDPRMLAYVSVFKKAEGRFDYECEAPGGPGHQDYLVTSRGRDVGLGTWIPRASQKGALPDLALSGSGLLVVSADAIRTYSTSEVGELTLVETAVGSFSSVAFHPSGAFLYASGSGLLRTYAVSPEGRLTMFDELPHPAGQLVVTAPLSPGL